MTLVKAHMRNGKMVKSYNRGGGKTKGGSKLANTSAKRILHPFKSKSSGTEMYKIRSQKNADARMLLGGKKGTIKEYRKALKNADTGTNHKTRMRVGKDGTDARFEKHNASRANMRKLRGLR